MPMQMPDKTNTRAFRRRHKHPQRETAGFIPVYSKVQAELLDLPSQMADKQELPLSKTIARKEANKKKRPEPPIEVPNEVA